MGYSIVVSVGASTVAAVVGTMVCTMVDTMVDTMVGAIVVSESEFGLIADASRTTRRPNPSIYNLLSLS